MSNGARQAEKVKPQQAVISDGAADMRGQHSVRQRADRGCGAGDCSRKSPRNSEQLGYNLLIHLDGKFDKCTGGQLQTKAVLNVNIC